MTVNLWVEQIKRIALQVFNTRAHPRWGIVTNVKTSGSQVQVRMSLQPEGVLTGWIPVLATAAGATGATLTVPMVGWQGFVAPDYGEAEHSVVLGFTHSDIAPIQGIPNSLGTGGTQNTAPAQLQPGETVAVAFGSTFRLCQDGSVFIQPSNGFVKIDGDLLVNGDVSDYHGSLDRLRVHYNEHKHVVPTAPGVSNTTDTPDPE